jgi:hypothetical protein
LLIMVVEIADLSGDRTLVFAGATHKTSLLFR